MQGFQHWINPISSRSRAPTHGSVNGPEVLLAAAYHEQFNEIGWYQCSLGHISTTWARAVEAFTRRDQQTIHPAQWASAFITTVWIFTRNIWNHRNQILHGATAEDSAANLCREQHDKVKEYYNLFTENNTYLLPRHHYLFTQQDHLQLSPDHISCWLRSVEEARSILLNQEVHLRHTSALFFSMFRQRNDLGDPGSSTDSSYEPTLSTVTSLSTATQSTVSLTDYTSDDSTTTASIFHSSLHLLDIYTDDDTCIHSETTSLGASLSTHKDSFCAKSI